MKETMRQIMLSAWVISKETGFGIGYGLRMAWKSFRLQAKMRTDVVKFTYMKVAGGLREARGTLCGMFVPGGFSWALDAKDTRKRNDGVVTYYDMEKNGWRSFRKANLISIQ